MPHAQPIAFEISRRVGAVAPSAVPVRFVFNGALRSPAYELIEHVSREGWGRARLGHDDFHLYQYRASNLPSDEAAYADLRNFVNTAPSPLRMEAVKRRVDVENFVLHLFTIIYCGTADWGRVLRSWICGLENHAGSGGTGTSIKASVRAWRSHGSDPRSR